MEVGVLVYRLYRALTLGISPLIHLHMRWRRLRGLEHFRRWPERFGRPSAARPSGSLVWFHAVSLGEGMAAIPVIRRCNDMKPEMTILMTTTTVSAFEVIKKQLPVGVLHQFAPVDTPVAIDRFLGHWKPSAIVIMENELWPNLIMSAAQLLIPLALLNARMSTKSFKRWSSPLFLPLASLLLSKFSLIAPLSTLQGIHFQLLQAPPFVIHFSGDLKYVVNKFHVSNGTYESIKALKAKLSEMKVWIASSLHRGEEEVILGVHKLLLQSHPDSVVIIVPRHPHHGQHIAQKLRKEGQSVALRSQNEKLTSRKTNIYEHSENSKMNPDLSIEASQVLEGLGKKEEAKDTIEKQPIAKRVTRSQAKASKSEEDVDLKREKPSSSNAKSRSASSQSPEKKSVVKEKEVRGSTEKQITRSKATVKKKELTDNVARRASKRLAGIELEPTPELKTRTKAQRVVPPDNVEQPVSLAATDGLKKTDMPLTEEVAKSYSEHSSPEPNGIATSSNHVSTEMEVQIEKISKPVARNGSGDKKKMKAPLVISEFELNPVFHLDGYREKEEMSPVSPLSRQASTTKREKTPAGKRLGRSSPKTSKVTSPKAAAISPLRSSHKGNKPSNDSFQSSVVKGTYSGGVMENNTTNNSFSFSSSSAFDSTLADLWKDPCIAFAIKTLTGESISSDPNNNNHHAEQKGAAFFPETPEKPGLSSESLCMEDIWNDPCIDFAIKTLTGAIPIGLDEPAVKPKSEGTSARQEPEGRQNSSNLLVQQCSNMKKKKTGEI